MSNCQKQFVSFYLDGRRDIDKMDGESGDWSLTYKVMWGV